VVEFKASLANQGVGCLTAFKLSVANEKWFIQAAAHDGKELQKQEASFDGTNLYYVAALPHSAIDSLPTAQLAPIAVATVSSGLVPHDVSAHTLNPIWLGWASSRYLDAAKSGLVEPVTIRLPGQGGAPRTGTLKQRFTATRHKDPPNLPVRATWEDDPGEILPVRKPATSIPEDLIRASYTAESFANIDGNTIPMVARLDVREYRSSLLASHARYTVLVTNFNTHCSVTDFRPTLPRMTFVTDNRTEKRYGIPFQYLSAGDWAAEKEIVNSIAFKRLRVRRNLLPQPPAPSASRWRVAAAIATALCFPLVPYLIKFGSGISKSENQRS
jgi:hypothetical protein